MIRLFFKQILNTRKKILFSIILFLTTLNISAQLSEQEQKEVVKRAKKVISEYETKINNLGKDIKSIDKTKILYLIFE